MVAEMDAASFKTNRLLRKRSWWLLGRKGVYRKMLVVSALPLVVNVVFWVLALMGGTALSLSTHRVDHILQQTDAVSNGTLWLVVNLIVSTVVGVITGYAALEIQRSEGKNFEPGAVMARSLAWRYVLGTVMISVTIFIMEMFVFLAAMLLAAIAVAVVVTPGQGFSLVGPAVFILVLAAGGIVMLAVYLPFAQTRFLMKDAIDHDRDWTLFGLMKESRALMRGFKMDLLGLYLSMWYFLFLDLLTAGVGGLFFAPYIDMNLAGFYENLLRYRDLRRSLGMTASA